MSSRRELKTVSKIEKSQISVTTEVMRLMIVERANRFMVKLALGLSAGAFVLGAIALVVAWQ